MVCLRKSGRLIVFSFEWRGGSRAGAVSPGKYQMNDKRTELEIIEAFVRRVNERAERNIEKTHKLEGSYYAAMTVELRILHEADNAK